MGRVWRCIAESLRGASHEAEGSPCQDACCATVLGEGDTQCLVACVADGAGSAEHSDLGAAEACRAVVAQATAFHTQHQGFATLKSDDARAFVEHARTRVLEASEEHGGSPRDFATTLLVAISTPERAYFFQIGDGAIVVGKGGLYGVVFWPQSGEYANTTNFLTGDRFEEDLEFAMAEGPIDELALFTDGLERLGLVFETRTPHTPFCQPMLAGLRDADDLDRLGEELRGFLGSDSVKQRSDDDKSLVLATRCEG